MLILLLLFSFELAKHLQEIPFLWQLQVLFDDKLPLALILDIILSAYKLLLLLLYERRDVDS
jgi:hypothetical protein